MDFGCFCFEKGELTTYSKSTSQRQKQNPAPSLRSSRCVGKVFPWHRSKCPPSIYSREELSPEKALRVLVKAVICPASIHIREHLTARSFPGQLPPCTPPKRRIGGKCVPPWLGTKPQDIGSNISSPRDQIPTSYSRLKVSAQAKNRHKLFHLKPLASFLQLRHCLFSHYTYLAHEVSLNVAVWTSA